MTSPVAGCVVLIAAVAVAACGGGPQMPAPLPIAGGTPAAPPAPAPTPVPATHPYTGTYAMTLTIGSSCTVVPEAERTRAYTARFDRVSDGSYVVSLSDALFLHGLICELGGGRFAGLLQSGGRMDSRRDWAPMLDLLYAAANNGTGKRAALAVPTFGKTGTSQDNRDALFVGFAGDLVVGVWIGRDDDRPLGRKVSGGTTPAQVWRNFMVSALAVDGRAGPRLPAEFRIPEKAKPERRKESPLPKEWTEGAEPLRQVLKELEKLFE